MKPRYIRTGAIKSRVAGGLHGHSRHTWQSRNSALVVGMPAHIQVTIRQAHSQQGSVGRDGHAEDGPRVLCGMGYLKAVQLIHLQWMLPWSKGSRDKAGLFQLL